MEMSTVAYHANQNRAARQYATPNNDPPNAAGKKQHKKQAAGEGCKQCRQELHLEALPVGFLQGKAHLGHSVLGSPQATAPVHLTL